MAYEEILLSSQGAIGTITLNNPTKINALSRKMIDEMVDALGRVAADEAIKVLIIRARGQPFLRGARPEGDGRKGEPGLQGYF